MTSERTPRRRPTDALLRQWRMLRMIPRAPRKIDAATIEARLREEGHPIDRRSVQRDLQRLSSVFPIACDDAHKPYGWSWLRDASVAFERDEPRHALHGRALAFRARVRPDAVLHLAEGPVRIERRTRTREGPFELELQARDDVALRRHILGLGPAVEVLAPASLRAEIRSILGETVRLYEGRGLGERTIALLAMDEPPDG